jgi:hypothetical protein
VVEHGEWLTNDKRPTNNKQQTTNNKQQTTNNKQQTTNNRQGKNMDTNTDNTNNIDNTDNINNTDNWYENFVSFSFFMASTPQGLREITGFDATVEAEYGNEVIEGKYATLAHHGPRMANPAPCAMYVAAPLLRGAIVGLSHFDLDGLGGCMRLAGYKPRTETEEAFWLLVAELDVRGCHQMKSILNAFQLSAEMEEKIKEWYHAFQAWSQKNRYFPPRDGSLTNCTLAIRGGVNTVSAILKDNPTLLAEGERWLEAQRTLDRESLKDD